MALDPDKILSHPFATRRPAYEARDAILYALCCGAGRDGDLSLVHEDGLRVIPSFGQNLCFDDSWMPLSGVDLSRVVHGGLDLRMHRPFPASGQMEVRPRIAGLTDKGEGKAALILLETQVFDQGELVFTSLSNLFVMGGGGFGGSRGEAFEMIRTPEAEPNQKVQVKSREDGPLFFRLLGDLNPLHVFPEVAEKAGFPRPILHGANTFGIACADALSRYCDNDPARMKRFAARFSGPLFPGETLELSYWQDGETLRFAAKCAERGTPVLDGGLVEMTGKAG